MYGKIFRQIYHGTLATTGPWQAIVTFQQLIVLSDAEGVVDMTLDSISRETTIPREILEIGMQALEQPDSESRSPEEDGRRVVKLSDSRKWGWRIVNFLHYRKLRSEEDRREYHKQYWKTKRSPKITDSTETQQYSTILNTTQPTQPTQPMQDAGCRMQDSETEASKTKIGSHTAARPSTRLTEDFQLTEKRREIAETEQVDPVRTFANFCDYWQAASGRNARKLDWDAAWRVWCRNQADRPNSATRGRRAGKSISQIIDEACERE